MRKSVTLAVVAISCLIALLAVDRVALGQAGSTGGTIGKTDKSVSGEEEQTPPQAPKPEGSSGEDICIKALHPDWCRSKVRCLLRTGGHLYPDPRERTGYGFHIPNRALYFECLQH
jgi:hypothetical protein